MEMHIPAAILEARQQPAAAPVPTGVEYIFSPQLTAHYDMESRAMWSRWTAEPRPCFNPSLLADIRAYYEMLFASMKGESVTPVRRLYGDDFVVDEVIWNGRVDDGRPFLCDGMSGPVSFRLLHVFELRDGKISRENVWCDLAAIQQQLKTTVSAV